MQYVAYNINVLYYLYTVALSVVTTKMNEWMEVVSALNLL